MSYQENFGSLVIFLICLVGFLLATEAIFKVIASVVRREESAWQLLAVPFLAVLDFMLLMGVISS